MTLNLSWERAGDGQEPLVLLHGIGSTREDFAAVRSELEKSFDVLAPDLPGHGQSPRLTGRPTVSALADAIEADLDSLGLVRAHLLGNSLGGRLALELAFRGRARSVVAIAPSWGRPSTGARLPGPRDGPGASEPQTRSPAHRPPFPVTSRAHRPAHRASFRSLVSRRGRDARLERWFRGVVGVLGPASLAVIADVPHGLRPVDVPVVLAQGSVDVIASWQTPRYLFLVPGSSFVPLWGAGHAPQSDTPEAIVSLVQRAVAASAKTRP